MELYNYFSETYAEARSRFRSLAQAHKGRTESHEIGLTGRDGSLLTLDVAHFGPEKAKRRLLLSSGTHGVEGFFGSAVQLAFMDQQLDQFLKDAELGITLFHAINPFGFEYVRRVNEDNADLNRNFLLDTQDFSGADEAYEQFDPVLNPKSAEKGVEFFFARASYYIARYGLPALKNALVSGQYAFPQGLFFGGHGPSSSQQILKENLPRWTEGADKVIHIDYHTGLGKWGSYVLANADPLAPEETAFLHDTFGSECVETLDPEGTLYEIRGALGRWCKAQLPNVDYHCMLAEFGTYPILFVIDALRAENRNHHWGAPDAMRSWMSKVQLKEAFAPRSRDWRNLVVEKGIQISEQAIRGMAN